MDSPNPAGERPTSVRWLILALLFVVSFVAYVQRLNFNVAGKFMMDELGFSKGELGWMISAFILFYTVFQLPGGVFGEKIGSRRTLTWVVVLWGALTALSALAPDLHASSAALSLGALLIVRALMGVFQAPLFPVVAGSIAVWFPVNRWALPNALTSTGLTLGAMATPPLVAWVAVSVGWRASLYVTVPITVAVAALWWWYVRDHPDEHRGVNDAELALIQSGTSGEKEESSKGIWLEVLANREVLLLTASYFCAMYTFYFFFSWFFIYLVEDRGFTALEGGFAASVPWLAAAIGATAGGAFCDWACTRWGPRWGCRGPCVVALVLVTICLIFGAMAESARVALVFLSLAFGFVEFTEGAYWAGAIFVARSHAPAATGVLNTGGNLVGVVSTQMFVLLESQFGAMVAVASGGVFALLGAALWMFIRVDRPLRVGGELEAQ